MCCCSSSSSTRRGVLVRNIVPRVVRVRAVASQLHRQLRGQFHELAVTKSHTHNTTQHSATQRKACRECGKRTATFVTFEYEHERLVRIVSYRAFSQTSQFHTHNHILRCSNNGNGLRAEPSIAVAATSLHARIEILHVHSPLNKRTIYMRTQVEAKWVGEGAKLWVIIAEQRSHAPFTKCKRVCNCSNRIL